VAAVGADGALVRGVVARLAVGADADKCRGVVDAVADVELGVRAGALADEGHVLCVRAHPHVDAVAGAAACVEQRAGVGDADQLHGTGLRVLDEDVHRVVGVAGDQVVGLRLEGHVPAVGADHRGLAVAVARHARRTLADHD
jgi:hypothetical protein